jgi:hypothetical protein
MTHPRANQRKSAAFDDLLWQITGELALTPASASIAGAPFLDLDPEPDSEPDRSAASARRAPDTPAGPEFTRWMAGLGAALLVAALGFGVGVQSSTPDTVPAIELAELHESGMVMAVMPGPDLVIPAAPEQSSAPPAPPAVVAEPEAEKPTPKRRTRRRPKASPKKQPVAFEDL